MNNKIYNDTDFIKAQNEKNRYKIIFLSILGIYLILSMLSFFWYRSFPYKHSKIKTVKLLQYLNTAFFLIVLYVFYHLKLKRVNAYAKTLGYINSGLKENNYGEFLRFDHFIEVKENVEFVTMVMSEYSYKKQDFYERKVLLDLEKPLPPLNEGDKVEYITQGNILIEYEISKESE